VVGAITFGDAVGGAFRSVLPLLPTPTNKRFILGHLANGQLDDISFFTGIAILNPHTLPKLVILSAYDQSGVLLDSTTLTLQAKHRSVFMLDQVLPGLTSIFGGYLIVENTASDTQMLVFELFGDHALTFLSAVPAVPID
jgi:hypothetical protein